MAPKQIQTNRNTHTRRPLFILHPHTHLDVLPRLIAVDSVLHIEPQVEGELVHELGSRRDDVAVPGRLGLGRDLVRRHTRKT